jgi:protein gp37
VANGTGIEWTEATWNPIAGCTMVSPGCTNCYAMRMAARLQAIGLERYQGTTRRSGGRHVWSGRIVLDREALRIPLRWKRPRHIFVNSMSDLFHEGVPETFIREVWTAMETAHQHTYQILTKRPDRMLDVLRKAEFRKLPNVWLGTSVENEAAASRIEVLRSVPAVIRFVSFEPLIGSVGKPSMKGIHWAIVGGESGPNARPIDTQWVDDILQICQRQDVAFFFKQWGGKNKKAAGRRYRGKTWDEMPDRVGARA